MSESLRVGTYVSVDVDACRERQPARACERVGVRIRASVSACGRCAHVGRGQS